MNKANVVRECTLHWGTDRQQVKTATLIRSSTIGSIPWEQTIEQTTETMTLALIVRDEPKECLRGRL